MHNEEKSVNKSIPIDLHDVDFRADGMFLMKDYFHEIRLSKLVNEGSDYIAFWRVDYVCGNCKTKYDEHPGVCQVCGSSDIREREIDLWPIGSVASAQIIEHNGKG